MDVMVLCYHALSPTWAAPLSVTPEGFEQQLTHLVRRGWRGVTFSEALLSPQGGKLLAVTFDDAFASVGRLARPVLDALGLPATVFVPTDFPGTAALGWAGIDHWATTEHAGELACLSWDALRELADSGWEIGSHTRSHPRLTALSGATLKAELDESRLEISRRLGRPCQSIAYPYGDVDARVAEQARAAGYQAGAAMSSRLTPLGRLRWPRVGIYHADTSLRFRLKVSRGLRGLRASPLWISR